MYKQIIIARKDLKMSPGKLSAQVSHASMAFLTGLIKSPKYTKPVRNVFPVETDEGHLYVSYDENGDILDVGNQEPEPSGYEFSYIFEKDLFENWMNGSFTKCVLEARNKNQLLKAKKMAEEKGMKEGKDFFLIRDSCRTELTPEETDENGVGRTLTCIGFRPMEDSIIDPIGKKYQLYR